MDGFYPATPPAWPQRPGREPPPLPLAMRPKTLARAIGVSERTLWTLTKRDEIPHVRIGTAVIYPTAAILAWLDKRTNHPLVKRPDAADGGAE